jgi:hypothetical protein
VILICYDESPDSQAGIDHAGELLPGEPVTILTVSVPFIDVMARTGSGLGLAPGMVNIGEIDAASEQTALGAQARASSALGAWG